MRIDKILWAFDSSTESEEALNYAVFLAKNFDSEIVGVHVMPAHEKLLYETEFRNWTVKVEESIGSRLSSLKDEMTSQGINFQGLILKGNPKEEIVEFAHREKTDLIVMGKRGQGLIDRMLTGSTTLRVMRESKVPVLTVKKRDEKGTLDIKSILVPLDISEYSESALNYAIDLGVKLKASITVLYVLSMYIYDYEIPYTMLDDLIRVSSFELSKRTEEIRLKRLTTHGEATALEMRAEAVHGINSAISIVDYASEKNCNLIVIDTHARKGIKKLILGSVMEKVVQEAQCAVLVVNP